MTFFVDANVIVYANTASPQRASCLAIMTAISQGAAGRTSAAVVQEIQHLELTRRVPELAGVAGDAYRLFAPLLPITDDASRRSLELHVPRLGAMDRLHAGTCADHGIGVIVSADTGFDGVDGLQRVDPLDERACGELLSTA